MARYIPGLITDPVLRAEFDKVAQAAETPDAMLNLDPVFAAPKKFRDGSIVYAKSPWNPGSGDGVYLFRAGSWRFLG